MPEENIQQTGPLTGQQIRNLNNERVFGDLIAPAKPYNVFNPGEDITQDVYSPLNDGKGDYWGRSRFDRRNPVIQDSQFEDLSELRAQEQSGFNKILNGTIKMLTTAGTTFLDDTVGFIYGLGTGVANLIDDDVDTTFKSGLWNNAFNRAMADAQDAMERIAPNYYTEKELSNPWYKNIFTANFLGDKFLKNMGFTMGTLAAMAVPGVGSIAEGLGTGVETLAKSISFASALKGSKFANRVFKGAKSAGAITQKLVNTAISAHGEAAIEAINAVKGNKDNFVQNLENWRIQKVREAGEWYDAHRGENGAYQQYLDMLGEIDAGFEQANRENDLTVNSLGNSVYGMNMLLLSITNNLEFGKYIKGGFNQSKSIANVNKIVNGVNTEDLALVGRSLARGEAVGFGQKEAEKATVGSVLRGTLARNLEEGFEEGAQNLISDSGQMQAQAKVNVALKDWSKKHENSLFAQSLNPAVTDDLVNRSKAYMMALKENFGTIDAPGWEEVFLGALTGGIGTLGFRIDNKTGKVIPSWQGGFWEEIRKPGEQAGRDEVFVEELNRRLVTDNFRKRSAHAITAMALADGMEADLINDDVLRYKNKELMQIANDLIYAKSVGGIEMYRSFYEELAKNISDQDIAEVKEAFRNPVTGQSYFDALPNDEIKQRMQDKAKSTLEKIDSVIESYDWHLSTYGQKFAATTPFAEQVDFLLNEVVTLDALQKDLVRRKKELINKRNALDETIPEDKEEIESIDKSVKEIDAKINEVQEQYDKYTKHPEKLQEDMVKIRNEALAHNLRKDADTIRMAFANAETIQDIANIYYSSNPSKRDDILDKVYETAEPELKQNIDTFKDYVATTQVLPDVVANRAKNIGLDVKATGVYNNIIGATLDNVVQRIVATPNQTFEDPQNLVSNAIRQEATSLRNGTDGYNRNESSATTFDFVANELDKIADDLDKETIVYKASKAGKQTTQPQSQAQSQAQSQTQPQTQSTQQSVQQQQPQTPAQGTQTQPQGQQQPQQPVQSQPQQPVQTPQPPQPKTEPEEPEQEEPEKGESTKQETEKPEGNTQPSAPSVEQEKKEEAPELVSLQGNSFLQYSVDANHHATERHGFAVDWFHDFWNSLSMGYSIDDIQNNYIWKLLQLDAFQGKDGKGRIPVRYVKFNKHLTKSNGEDAGMNRFVFLATEYTHDVESVFPEEMRPKLRLIDYNGKDYLIIGTLKAYSPEGEHEKTPMEKMFDDVEQAARDQVLDRGESFTVLDAGENGEYTNYIYQVNNGEVITSFPKDYDSTDLNVLLNNPSTNPRELGIDDLVFAVVLGNEETHNLTVRNIGKNADKYQLREFVPSYAGQVYVYLPDSTGAWIPWGVNPLDFMQLMSLPDESEIKKNIQKTIHELAVAISDTEAAGEKLKAIHTLLGELRGMLLFGSPNIGGSNFVYNEPEVIPSNDAAIEDTTNPASLDWFVSGVPMPRIELDGMKAEDIETKLYEAFSALNPTFNIQTSVLQRTPEYYIENGVLTTDAKVLGTVNAQTFLYPLNEDMTPNTEFVVTRSSQPSRGGISQKVWFNGNAYRKVNGTYVDAKGRPIKDTEIISMLDDVINLTPETATFTYHGAPYWIIEDRAYTSSKNQRYKAVSKEMADSLYDKYLKKKAEEERKNQAKQEVEKQEKNPQMPPQEGEEKEPESTGQKLEIPAGQREKTTIFVNSFMEYTAKPVHGDLSGYMATMGGINDYLEELGKERIDATVGDVLTLMVAGDAQLALDLSLGQVMDAIWNSKYQDRLANAVEYPTEGKETISDVIDNIIKCGL